MNVETFCVSHQFIKNQCYFFYDDKDNGVLVDPAWNYHLINDFLVFNNIALRAVLLTHAHPDHTDLAQRFAAKYNIPVYMSAAEINDTGFNCTNLTAVEHLQIITAANSIKITPIITPGHTAGSTCYLVGQHLFCGDTIFMEGVGICENADDMFDSVQLLKSSLPSNTQFWPGHSFGQLPGKDLEFLLKNNIYFQFEKRKHFIDFRMRKNQPSQFMFR